MQQQARIRRAKEALSFMVIYGKRKVSNTESRSRGRMKEPNGARVSED
jgi:hypothetical protein